MTRRSVDTDKHNFQRATDKHNFQGGVAAARAEAAAKDDAFDKDEREAAAVSS